MFTLRENGNLKYYQVDEFSKTGLVKHCFTTRCTGVSEGNYFSLNLRFNCEDSRENVLANYKIICDEINVDYKNLVLSKQVHEDNVLVVTGKDLGNGITKEQKFVSCDAMITKESGVPIAVFSADCVPVCFLDVKKSVIGLAHSGWKGTVARISQKVVEKMKKEFGSDAKDIIVGIGPSIRECHFEVGYEVADIFKECFGDSVVSTNGKPHVDMQKAIKLQLISEGILEENIVDSNICTYCNNDLFFSHRVSGDKRGLQAAIMELI